MEDSTGGGSLAFHAPGGEKHWTVVVVDESASSYLVAGYGCGGWYHRWCFAASATIATVVVIVVAAGVELGLFVATSSSVSLIMERDR